MPSTASRFDSPRIPLLITIRTYPRLYIVHIIPRPIVTAGIVNLSETPCTTQITACSFEFQKSHCSLTQHIRAHPRRDRHRTRQHPRSQQNPVVGRHPVARHPSLPQKPAAGRRPVDRRPASQQSQVRAGHAVVQQPCRSAPDTPPPSITAKSGPRRTRRRPAAL